MSGSDDLAPYLLPEKQDFGYRQGVVVAWDALTGTNVVNVDGRDLVDLDILATSDSIFLGPGDPVLLLQFRSTLCIMGRIAPAGTGQLGVRSAEDAATGFVVSGTTYGDLSIGAGPTLADFNIGSRRSCLVVISAGLYASPNNHGAAHFAVSGASTISPPSGPSAFSEGAFLGAPSGGIAVEGCVSKTFLLTAADGLNKGLNTFTMKYMCHIVPSDEDTFFSDRNITVWPL